MPTDLNFKRRPSNAALAFDAFLVLGRRCLMVLAVLLATLLFVELQILAWRSDGADQGIPPELQVTVTSP